MVRREAPILTPVRWRLAALLFALLAAMLLLAPLVPEPQTATRFRLLAYPSHALWFLAIGALAATLAPLWQLPRRWLVAALVVAFALVIALNVASVPVASDLAKVAFGVLAGLAFVRALERPWWLVPIALCVPVADAWSVFSERGVTHAVVERGREDPAWIEWPTIASPIAGYGYESFGRIGIVDILFLALFLGAAVRWRLGVARGVVAMAIGFVLTSALVFEAVDLAVPALPLLCLAFLLAYAPGLWRDARDAARGG